MNRLANQFARWAVVWTICVSTLSVPFPADAAKPRLFRRWRESRQPAKPQKPVAKQQDKQPPVAEVTPQTEALTFSGVTGPPAAFHPGNITNLPGSNGQVFESNGDGTYTFGTDDGGVGGGATELSGLDDVADTLTGNAGEFIGWSGTEWDDLTISFDTMSDVAITTPATKQTVRYNGSGWVNSQLASTDLSDFAATISGDANDILAWNGSAFDDTPFVTAVTSAFGNGTDNYVLTADGAGGVAWEASLGVDATGVTDGWVLTADGADGSAFEAPSVGGLLTPDGGTTITRSGEFSVRDYKASGSRKIFRITSSSGTYTTKNAAGSAISHDFSVGQGCIIGNAGAVADVTAPDVAKSAVTNAGTPGGTTYTYKAVAIDADGGRSAASSALTTTTGAATLNSTDYNIVSFDMPRGTVAMAIYKSDVLVTVLDCAQPVRVGTDTLLRTFTLANNGGSIRLTVTADHGIQTGDYVHIKTDDASDAVYDVTAECTTAGATTLDFSGVAYDGTATTASGTIRRARMEWADHGTAPLHESKYLPDMENPPLTHRTSAAVWQGQLCIAEVSGTKYLYRCTRAIGTRMTGAAAPTWTNDPTVPVVDNEVTWMLEPYFVDLDIPAGAQRKTLFSKIATVPTASTFTLDDAAGADISVSRLLCAHNDALAFRECVAAARTYGQHATIRIPAGDYSCYLPAQTNTTYWSLPGSGFTTQPCFLFLNSGIRGVAHPTVSIVADQAATIRGRYCQNSLIAENLTAGGSDHLNNGTSRFITLATDGGSIIGGEWEWAPYAGGFTEHDGSDSYGAAHWWVGDALTESSNNAATPAYGATFRDVRVHWPCIHDSAAITGFDSSRKRNSKWLNCELYFGGGDADQTFLPHGDFLYDGGIIEAKTRTSSHAFYLGVANDNYKIVNCTIKGVSTSGKRSIQARGTGGDTWISTITIDNVTFVKTGTVLIGDATSSNRVHRTLISNCNGAGVNVTLAECRNLTISGGTYGTVTLGEDCSNIKIVNATVDAIDTTNATDTHYQIAIDNVTFTQQLCIRDIDGVTVNNCRTANPYVKTINLVSGLYDWVSTGHPTANEYHLRLRATAGDPGLSSPAGVLVRDNVTIAAETPDSLAVDTWYYGTVREVQAIAISGSPTGGSFTVTFDGNTSGSIAAGASAATVQTALRLVTGLGSVVVSQSGSGNNLTYTVVMTGASGDPPQMTSTSSLTGGTPVITHATPFPYVSYNTLTVKLGDSNQYDPDDNFYGAVQTVTVTATVGLRVGGTLSNAVFSDIRLRTNWNSKYALLSNASTSQSYRDVTFRNILTEMTGLTVSSTGTLIMWDFGSTNLVLAERIVIEGCKWRYPIQSTTAQTAEIRMLLGRGGHLTLRNNEMLGWGSGPVFGTTFGTVHCFNNQVQTNELLCTVVPGSETFVPIAGYGVDTTTSNSVPVMIDIGSDPLETALPVCSPTIAVGQVVWHRDDNNRIYPTSADATADTNAYTVTSGDGPIIMRVLDAAQLSVRSANEFLGDLAMTDALGQSKGNLWRGSDSATYAALTGNVSDYQLCTLVNTHRLSSDASREIDGFNAPGGGSVTRRDRIINVGAQDIVLKDDTDTGSVAQNRIACHTNADVTISAGESIEIEYDTIAQVWRTIGYTASLELKSDILPLRRVAQWAIEPKRIQLTLAA